MSAQTEDLDRLVKDRMSAWDEFMAAGGRGIELADTIDALDTAIDRAIEAVNVEIRRLYAAYRTALRKAEVSGRYSSDRMWKRCRKAQQAWRVFRDEAGLREGELGMTQYIAYRKIKEL